MIRLALLLFCVTTLTFQAYSQDLHGNRGDYAVYGPNGKYLAIAGIDLLLMNRSNEEVKLLNAYAPGTVAASFSNDGKLLAAQTKDFGIYIYSVESSNNNPIFFQGIKKKANVQTRLKFSPDNSMIATSNSEKVVIYSLKEGSVGRVVLSIPIDPKNSNRSLAAFDASKDWKKFFFNMQAIEVTLAPKPSYKYGRILSWPRVVTNHSALSEDGSKVVVSGRNGLDQRVYDLKTGSKITSNSNLKTYALAANKDFSKIYMNQAVLDIKTNKMKVLYQRQNMNKNTKGQITIAENGDFMIGLYQYDAKGSLKANLQYPVATLNRTEFSGNQVIFYRDYINSNRFDSYSADFVDGVRGRSSKNLINKNLISTALATAQDGSYGINHTARIRRRANMTVSSPIFPLGSNKGLAAAISANHFVALVNKYNIYIYDLSTGEGSLKGAKALPSIKLPSAIPDSSSVKMAISPDGKYVGLSITHSSIDKEFGSQTSKVMLYSTSGTLIKTIETNDVGALAFSNLSDRFYYSSGKQLICYSAIEVDGKDDWSLDDTYSWYTESGAITGLTLSEDDESIAYTTGNGHSKVVKAAFGNDVIKCVLNSEDKISVTK